MSRSQAEDFIGCAAVGTFLVRSSEHYRGDYTLSLRSQTGVEHYRIIRKNDTYTIDEESKFPDLPKLVDHYERDADGLCCSLVTPAGCMDLRQNGEKCGHQDDVLTFDKNVACFIDPKFVVISDILGEGEYARVYKGRCRGLEVAVKIIKDASHFNSFAREATIMRKLDHPHIMSSYGISVLPNKHFPNAAVGGRSACILMEYMPCGNLHEYLMSRGRTKINSEALMGFLRDICEALVYLEANFIAHCDIAANNVLLDFDLSAKLSDFGLAIKYGDSFSPKFGKSSDHKEKIRIKWAAPESLKGDIHTNKSDIWSFGVFIWEVFQFGRTPYPRIRNSQMLEYISSGNRMDLPENLPTLLNDLVKRCWHADPNHRPTFVEALSTLKDHLTEKSM